MRVHTMARRKRPVMSRDQAVVTGQTPGVRNVLMRSRINGTLRVGAIDNPLEREADEVADRVMRMSMASPRDVIHRCPGGCPPGGCGEHEEIRRQPLQTASLMTVHDGVANRTVNAASTTPGSTAHRGLSVERESRTGCQSDDVIHHNNDDGHPYGWVTRVDLAKLDAGSPLSDSERRFFEPRFSTDLSRVRVHTGSQADELATRVGARAFTHVQDVVFRQGEFRPHTTEGRRLLAHELTHTVQQETGFVSAPIQRQTQQGTSPPPATTEDCELWQTTMLNNHLDKARTWVGEAAAKISVYASIHASPRHTAVPADPASSQVVRDALQDNFHTTRVGVLTIRDNFNELKAALNESFAYECGGWSCDGNRAYVRSAFGWTRRLFDINICPPWFSCNDYFRRVSTLIHERAHQYPGATDNAYEWWPSYATISTEEAIDNAESYAVAARQIYHGGNHGPGTHGDC